jgi:uncharacterized protein (DUF427 family)
MAEEDRSQEQERQYWREFQRERPADIIQPGPGQESVWDYPRPPRVEPVSSRIRVIFGGIPLADSTRALRVIETSSPPVYYLPPADVRMEHLSPTEHTTFCEWKGVAHYWTVQVGDKRAARAAWSYPAPDEGYEAIRDHLAFYAFKMEACYVGEQLARPQPGHFYGGWVTPNIVGPFKGEPGTQNW